MNNSGKDSIKWEDIDKILPSLGKDLKKFLLEETPLFFDLTTLKKWKKIGMDENLILQNLKMFVHENTQVVYGPDHPETLKMIGKREIETSITEAPSVFQEYF